MMGLTPIQAKALDTIRRLTVGGIAPSYVEIGAAMGLASKSGVHRLVLGLEERGAIRRMPDRKRAIQIVGAPSRQVMPALDELPTDELLDLLARAVGVLAHRQGVPEVAAMLHRLGDQLPGRPATSPRYPA